MSNHISKLQKHRLEFKPVIPAILQDPKKVNLELKETLNASEDKQKLQEVFPYTCSQPLYECSLNQMLEAKPLRIGVVFSGGQASGGHNVISGLFDALKELHNDSVLLGFLGGPSGIVDNKIIEITEDLLKDYRNQGGFDLIGSGRTKIETKEQLDSSKETALALNLDGIVVIGGDDSNTNAAVLAEYFLQENINTKVIGVPKTIDGDLKNEFIEVSFGFDTACKCYSEMIGNIARDALSAKKYYHFIKLMGRSASHIALECALATNPNYLIVGEAVEKSKKTLSQITKDLADLVEMRSKIGKNYGVVLIPEGLIEFIPEVKNLIGELNAMLAEGTEHFEALSSVALSEKTSYVLQHLSNESKSCFSTMPERIQEQLLLDRDPHGNVQVSRIETEKLLIEMVEKELKEKDVKFNALHHFFGYEGRAAMPSNFDAQYCYALGRVAAILINSGLTGYMSCVYDLLKPVKEWKARALPITMMMNFELRGSKMKPVIKKALVELDAEPYQKWIKMKDVLAKEDRYLYPGAIQYFGPVEVTDSLPFSMEE